MNIILRIVTFSLRHTGPDKLNCQTRKVSYKLHGQGLFLKRFVGAGRTAFFVDAFTDDGEKFTDTSSITPASTGDARKSLQAYATVEADGPRLDAPYSRIDLEDFWLFGTPLERTH